MRLKQFAERRLGEYQCEFRIGRETTEQLFIVRQIIEKCYEHDIDLCILFMDRQKQKLTMSTNFNYVTKLTISESLAFNNRVKQDDGLSPTLFIIVLHYIMKDVNQWGVILNKKSLISTHADDMIIGR